VERRSGMVPRWTDLHRRDIQERREAEFRQGRASLKDPADLFNASLEGNTRRAIDFHEGDEVDGMPSRRSYVLL
jgi:hypothetical protein